MGAIVIRSPLLIEPWVVKPGDAEYGEVLYVVMHAYHQTWYVSRLTHRMIYYCCNVYVV